MSKRSAQRAEGERSPQDASAQPRGLLKFAGERSSAGLRRFASAVAVALALTASGCLGPRGPRPVAMSFRLSQVANDGDPARRASTRLVLDALRADAAGRPEAAADLYQRALQIDPTNPWAYFALARHRAEGVDPATALPLLDEAESRLRLEKAETPAVEADVVGLRGQVLRATGHVQEALPLLRRARQLDPTVWSDGRLDASELE